MSAVNHYGVCALAVGLHVRGGISHGLYHAHLFDFVEAEDVGARLPLRL